METDKCITRDCCKLEDLKIYRGMQYKNIGGFTFPTIGRFCVRCGQLFQKEDMISDVKTIPWMGYIKYES